MDAYAEKGNLEFSLAQGEIRALTLIQRPREM
jgi:hypothetical protein